MHHSALSHRITSHTHRWHMTDSTIPNIHHRGMKLENNIKLTAVRGWHWLNTVTVQHGEKTETENSSLCAGRHEGERTVKVLKITIALTKHSTVSQRHPADRKKWKSRGVNNWFINNWSGVSFKSNISRWVESMVLAATFITLLGWNVA